MLLAVGELIHQQQGESRLPRAASLGCARPNNTLQPTALPPLRSGKAAAERRR